MGYEKTTALLILFFNFKRLILLFSLSHCLLLIPPFHPSPTHFFLSIFFLLLLLLFFLSLLISLTKDYTTSTVAINTKNTDKIIQFMGHTYTSYFNH